MEAFVAQSITRSTMNQKKILHFKPKDTHSIIVNVYAKYLCLLIKKK